MKLRSRIYTLLSLVTASSVGYTARHNAERAREGIELPEFANLVTLMLMVASAVFAVMAFWTLPNYENDDP